jgi:hypothetical protein
MGPPRNRVPDRADRRGTRRAVDDEPIYLLSIVDRGTDALLARAVIGDDLAAALKAEARRRDDESAFFGHIRLREPAWFFDVEVQQLSAKPQR